MDPNNNFLAYPAAEINPASARAVLIPVPYDETVSYRRGTRRGPQAIIEASSHLEDFDLELMADPSQLGIYTTPEITSVNDDPTAIVNAVERTVSSWIRPNVLIGVLGGEHTVAIGSVRAMAKAFEGLTVLYLDAHADMRDEYQGSPYNHACTARRILESCSVVQVGVRSAEAEEWKWMNENNVPVITWPVQSIADVSRKIMSKLGDPVYVSVDLDVLDPSVMSAVGTPEPGGMDWHQLLGILRTVADERTIVGFDVTELAPGEGPEACSYTAAKLVYKLIGYALARPGEGGTSACVTNS